MIRRKITRTSQPQSPVQINKGTVFGNRRWACVFVPGVSLFGEAAPSATLRNSTEYGVGTAGRAVKVTASNYNSGVDFGVNAGMQLNASSGLIVFKNLGSYPAALYTTSFRSIVAGLGGFYIQLNSAGVALIKAEVVVMLASSNTATVGEYSALTWSYNGSTGRARVALNGVLNSGTSAQTFNHYNCNVGGYTTTSNGTDQYTAPVEIALFAISPDECFSDQALIDASTLSKAWNQIFAPQERKVFVSVTSSDLNITTTLVTADASGFTANVDRQLVIATSLGTATTSGFTANVDRQLSITTTLATTTASGFTANISSDLNVTATLATATASAFSANVDRQLSITTTLATANASGFTANVDRQLFITTTLATATASGFDASIALGGGLNITATRAVATASGFNVNITISTPQGSGWETYVAPIRKKTVKQFKEEFNYLTYFELEEKEDEVKSEIRLVEQDIRLNEDLGLDNLIVKLKLALKIQKAKLQAIKSVKQEKIQEAQVQQIQHEAIPIEYTQDIDIIHEDENIDADLSYIAAILRMKYFN
jgi:hypothetical protein